jgi:hypothetical protein
MAETLVSSFRQRLLLRSTAASSGVVGKRGVVRLGGMVGILLGPEGTSVHRWCGFVVLWHRIRAFIPVPVVAFRGGGWGVGGVVSGVGVCLLRIA